MQVGKHRDLRAQHRRIHRLVQIVNRTGSIALQNVLIFVVISGEKNNRNAGRFLALFDHLRQLESGHSRHAHVKNEQGEFFFNQRQKRVVSGLCAHQPIPRIVQHGFKNQQIARFVIHNQNVDLRFVVIDHRSCGHILIIGNRVTQRHGRRR